MIAALTTHCTGFASVALHEVPPSALRALTRNQPIPYRLVGIREQPQRKPMLDNQDVAVLTRVNELAERHGLKAYDFVATSKLEEDDTGITHVLEFEVPARGNALREERFDRMLKDIGIMQGDEAVPRGDTATIIDALDNALQLAPRPRLGL
jgi:hypothetical protein